MLREYYTQYKPKLAFEGQVRGQRYSEKLAKHFKASIAKKIGKPNKLHWLRHSYANIRKPIYATFKNY
jgi:hypothetical protein